MPAIEWTVWPATSSRTRSIVERVAVKTSCATRMAPRPPLAAANARLTSTVAVRPLVETPAESCAGRDRRADPSGRLGGVRSAKSCPRAARATPGVRATVRVVSQSVPSRSSRTCRVILGPACGAAAAGPALTRMAASAAAMR